MFGIRITRDLFNFTMYLTVPTLLLFAYTTQYGLSNQQKEQLLREKNRVDPKTLNEKNKQLEGFFAKLKSADKEQQALFDDILKKGKGTDQRRQLPPSPSSLPPAPPTAGTGSTGTNSKP